MLPINFETNQITRWWRLRITFTGGYIHINSKNEAIQTHILGRNDNSMSVLISESSVQFLASTNQLILALFFIPRLFPTKY